jgi:biopolymer transport protein ExbD
VSQERRHRILASSSGQAFDLAPLIDVLFLLLVFFLVATTFEKRNLSLPLQLPAAEAGAPPPEGETLRIEITPSAFAAAGRTMSLAGLRAELAAAAAAKREVVIASDRSVAYERFVRVLDLARQAAVASVTLEAERAGD